MSRNARIVSSAEWPQLPSGGVFPEMLIAAEVAQLLRYDASGISLERAVQNVRWLVRNRGLPVAGKVGQKYLFKKEAVLAWLSASGNAAAG